jgi:hypothetical protein
MRVGPLVWANSNRLEKTPFECRMLGVEKWSYPSYNMSLTVKNAPGMDLDTYSLIQGKAAGVARCGKAARR